MSHHLSLPSDLKTGTSLTIQSKSERIVWMRKDEFLRRFHFRNGKLLRQSVNRSLGSNENDEFLFRCSLGWKVA